MQCQSYFPVCQSNYDLNLDSSGGARTIHNGNGTFQSGHYSKYVLASPISQGPMEFLRQTILMHEATFRDQVQELHRLYRRQKELMGQIRSQELYMNHLHLESQFSNSFPKYSSNGFQNSHFMSSNEGIDTILTPSGSFKDERIPSSPIVSLNDGNLNFLHIPESKARKIGGKFLDLELPAEEYIDCEEGESLEGAKFFEPPMPTSLSSNKPSTDVVETDPVASNASQGAFACSSSFVQSCNVVGTEAVASNALRGGFPSFSSFAQSKTNLTDLNELTIASSSGKNDGIVGDEGTNHGPLNSGKARLYGASGTLKLLAQQVDNVNSEVCCNSSWRKTSTSLEKNSCVVQALPCLANQILSSKRAKTISRTKGPIDDKLDASSMRKSLKSSCSGSNLKDSMVSLSSVTSDHLIHVNRLNYIDLNFTPSSDTPKASAEVDGNGKGAMLSKSSISEISLSCEDGVRLMQSDTRVNSRVGEATRKGKKCRLIDINLPCDPTIEDEAVIGDLLVNSRTPPKSSSSDRIALDIDLEAPPSPEVEERPPPRGESEENLQETSKFSTPANGGDCFEELAKVAAEAIFSMSSSSKSQSLPESINLKKCEVPDSRTLEWFAGLIDSLSHDLENDPCALDEFEAMTLELTEMKEEEYFCKGSSAQIEIVTCSLMPLATQARKGRTRRSKRKDFQQEVLPSLASLSRYEVTEDIQMIEGLMEAAGTPCNLTRARRACRMGRKPRAAKQPTPEVSGFHGGALFNWGKVSRRPRGQRSPASPSAVLTRWLEFSA